MCLSRGWWPCFGVECWGNMLPVFFLSFCVLRNCKLFLLVRLLDWGEAAGAERPFSADNSHNHHHLQKWSHTEHLAYHCLFRPKPQCILKQCTQMYSKCFMSNSWLCDSGLILLNPACQLWDPDTGNRVQTISDLHSSVKVAKNTFEIPKNTHTHTHLASILSAIYFWKWKWKTVYTQF